MPFFYPFRIHTKYFTLPNSSQTQDQGQNIILFHNSCGVEPYKLPTGTTVSINYVRSTDADCDDRITVFEELPNGSQGERHETTNETEFQDDWFNCRDITLRLDVNKDVDVMVITGSKYQSHKINTSRYRHKKAATNLKRDTSRHFGSMAISQSSKI